MKYIQRYLVVLTVIFIFFTCDCSVKATEDIPFADVPKDAWYYEDVCIAYNMKLINGHSTTTFAPNEFMTCAEAVKLAACMYQVYTNDLPFVVSHDPWYETYVDYCYEKRIISQEYNWNQNITRGEYMDIFSRALPEEALQEINIVDDGMIPDISMNHRYASSIYNLYRAGIVRGQDDYGNCAPDNFVKRCEVAAILTRMMDASKRVNINMEDTKVGQIEDTTSKYDEPIVSTNVMLWENGGKKPVDYTWDEFQDLSETEQETFFEWFGSSAEFENWMNSAENGFNEITSMYSWENGGKTPIDYTWDEFQDLNEIEQEAFFEWFDSADEFEAWMNRAR